MNSTIEFIVNAFKDGFDVNKRNQRELRRQPLMVEFWRAEDAALAHVFSAIQEEALYIKIAETAESLFQKLTARGRVSKGSEEQYKELCLRNARRIIWDTESMFRPDLSDELSPVYARRIEAELKQLHVWDRFKELYPNGIISINPEEPYFHE